MWSLQFPPYIWRILYLGKMIQSGRCVLHTLEGAVDLKIREKSLACFPKSKFHLSQ